MKVVWERLEARDLRLETLAVAPGMPFRWRLGGAAAGVSGSEPERLEAVGVVGDVLVSEFKRL